MPEVPEFKISLATQDIIDLMAERLSHKNPLISYDEIEKLTDRPLHAARGLVYIARKHIRRDYRKWYVNDRGKGYRVISDESLPDCGKQNRSKSRSLHRETIKIMEIANGSKQTPTARSRTMLEAQIADMSLSMTAPRTITKIEQTITRSHNKMNLEEQLAAIKEALG